MANFGGVYFLPFFPKTTLSASKWQKNPAGQWRAYIPNLKEIVILRHLEWFFENSEESRPPPKLAILRGVYCLPFFPKITLSASKWQFLEKIVGFRGNIAVLRHL